MSNNPLRGWGLLIVFAVVGVVLFYFIGEAARDAGMSSSSGWVSAGIFLAVLAVGAVAMSGSRKG